MKSLSAFLRHLFVEREFSSNETVDIDEITPSEAEKRTTRPAKSNKPSLKENISSKLIIQMNRILMTISILSFAAIILYPLINPVAQLPEVIPNTFSMTIGYFISALITYLEAGKSK